MDETTSSISYDIAIIGMDCKFPGADNANQYWNNLQQNIESISFFTNQQLIEAGIEREVVESENYVKANSIIKDVDKFDAQFFGYSPREAELMDPQQRLFLECAWHTLEDAGYVADKYKGLIGVYAGSGSNSYFLNNILKNQQVCNDNDLLNMMLCNEKDYLTTRVSYKLNLKGPSFNIQSACSTSLVAVHEACQSLLDGECDMAIAGGVNIVIPEIKGYTYIPGMIYSPDGHCRAFDEAANGTVGGNGVGAVLLKPLKQAREDNDHIYAVIMGSAVNNDGANKIGFTAPSVDGQVNVINEALNVAGVSSEKVGYVETHGTATPLGDSIEIAALKQVYSEYHNINNPLYIGSVKTNIGHLDAAAGVAGLIKTVFCLKYGMLPASLHFKKANPYLELENSGITINNKNIEWKVYNKKRIAGVSSFGIGGTNVHIILSEYQNQKQNDNTELSDSLIILSSKSKKALDSIQDNMSQFLLNNPDINLYDLSRNLQSCRGHFSYRRYITVSDIAELQRFLDGKISNRKFIENKIEGHKKIVFMFPGIGSQYINMGRDLYNILPIFRENLDKCISIIEENYNTKIRNIIYPEYLDGINVDSANDFQIAQMMSFIFEYTLSVVLINIGVKPDMLVGYSFGEYTAACIAGIVSLEDAIKMLYIRAKLVATLNQGIMLSVPLSTKLILPYLTDKLEISINNGDSCIVSGRVEDIIELEDKLRNENILAMRINSQYAMHSNMMFPIYDDFIKALSDINFREPKRIFISSMGYTKFGQKDVSDPKYWGCHLLEQVCFLDTIKEINNDNEAIFIEVGPGRSLSNLISRIIDMKPLNKTVQLVKQNNHDISDIKMLNKAIGKLWLNGIDIKWNKLYQYNYNKLSLPGYPFERTHYWVNSDDMCKIDEKATGKDITKRKDSTSWYYEASWQREYIDNITSLPVGSDKIVIFMKDQLFDCDLYDRLSALFKEIVCVLPGEQYLSNGNKRFTIDPSNEEHYIVLLKELKKYNLVPGHVIHLWNISSDDYVNDEKQLDEVLNYGFHSLININKSIISNEISKDVKISVISNHIHNITGEDSVSFLKATILGAVKIIPVENLKVSVKSIEISIADGMKHIGYRLYDTLINEIFSHDEDNMIAVRGNYRWKQEIKNINLNCKGHSLITKRGIYLILGGFGGMGFTIGKYLANTYEADIVIVSRSSFPPRHQWDKLIDNEKYGKKIRALLEIENNGRKVTIYKADVSDYSSMKSIIDEVYINYERIDGIIHAAGVRDTGGIIQNRTRADFDIYMESKVRGIWVLDKLIKQKKIGFMLLCSSIGNILYKNKFGQVAYNAANECLEAYSDYSNMTNNIPTYTIDWCDWLEVGMAMEVIRLNKESKANFVDYEAIMHGVTPTEGELVFDNLVNQPNKKVIVSPRDLLTLIKHHNEIQRDLSAFEGLDKFNDAKEFYERPDLSSTYEAAHTDTEKRLTKFFEDIFKMKSIGINDNFFELGGDSLKGMTLLARIRKEFETEINLKLLYKHSDIKQLAKVVCTTKKNSYDNILPCKWMEAYPLSSAQKRLYILQEMNPESTSYNTSISWTIEGKLDFEHLDAVFRKLIKRHQCLRTSFEMRKEELVQVIHDDVEFKVLYYDLSDCDDFERNIEEVLLRFGTPFNLACAPLIRAVLIKKNDNEHIMVINVHHIISDGTSLHSILRTDFIKLYKNEELPELSLQYKDYAVWQNEQMKSSIKEDEKYWLSLLADQLPILKLPTDFKRPEVFNFIGNQYDFDLSLEMSSKLKRLCLKYGCSLFMSLTSVFGIMLYKYTSQEDMIIGTSISGRNSPELENIVGMFVNQLALRINPKDSLHFAEFLENVNNVCLDAFENQNVQFEQLVDKLNLTRDSSRNPIFDVAFVLQNEKDYMGAQDYMSLIANEHEIQFKPYIITTKTAKYDMTWFAYEYDDIIRMSFEYCTSLFTKETIIGFSENIINIIEQICENPDILISDINILDNTMSDYLLYNYNNTYKELKNETVMDMFIRTAKAYPDRTALLCGSEKITYDKLNRRSNRLANYLHHNKSVQKNEKIGLLMNNSIEMVVAIYGIQKANAAFVPLDPQLPEERLKYIIDNAEIHKILLTKDYVKIASKLQWCCNSADEIICVDSCKIFDEIDLSIVALEQDLWNYVNSQSINDIDGGGWVSSYTGELFSSEEMAEYSENVIVKLSPYLGKNKSVLEIGCASGLTMYKIAPKVKFYYGTDLSNICIVNNQKKINSEDIQNIEVKCLPAHQINEVDYPEKFDVIIINSVIQNFGDYNYLRNVILKSLEVLKEQGIIFIGDVMDIDKKEDLIWELKKFKNNNLDKAYKTKIDWSNELFVPKNFFEDIAAEFSEIQEIQFSDKLGEIENELTKFRYDTIISVNKNNRQIIYKEKVKKQYDKHDIERFSEDDILLCTPDSPAYIIYTSGTTGQPKGTVINHKSLDNYIKWSINAYVGDKQYIMPLFSSLAFDLTLTTIYLPLASGNLIAIYDNIDVGSALINLIDDNICNIIKLTPSHLKIIKSMNITDKQSIEKMIVGGEQFELDLADTIYQKYQKKIRMFNEYGPTEATIGCMIYEYKPYQENGNAVLIGQPIDNVHIYILDNNMQPVPYNAIGEIYIGGECLSAGYLKCENLNEEKFVKTTLEDNTKLYKTGDLARRFRNGAIEYVGRIDEQIKVLGHRIEINEIKKKIISFGGIKDVIIDSNYDDNKNMYMKAYLLSDSEINIPQLRDYLMSELPVYMIPTYITMINRIPLTRNGKLDKKMLPDIEVKNYKSYIGARNEIDLQLIDIWSELLNLNKHNISIDDNFFEVGGNSLTATILSVKIRKILKVKITLVTIFKTPTLRQMSDYLRDYKKSSNVTFEKVSEKEFYMTSSAQKRIFIMQQIDLNSVKYNSPIIVRLKGNLDYAILENTVRKLIIRHESLRTSFTIHDDELVQVIHSDYELDFKQFDKVIFSDISSFIKPFKLNTLPLIRFGLFKEEEDVHIFVIDMHHIIADGISMNIIFNDFIQLYEGKELPGLQYQYKDFAEWQKKYQLTNEYKNNEKYWLREFSELAPELLLPYDYALCNMKNDKGKYDDYELSPELSDRLKKIAIEEGVTLNTVLLAIFYVLLFKLTGQNDIIIGTVTSGRTVNEVLDVVGMFVNTLALRTYPNKEKSFCAFLKEVNNKLLNGIDNEAYQFDNLVESLELKRDLLTSPLFNVIFEFQNYLNTPKTCFSDMKLEICSIDAKETKFDLELFCYEYGDRIKLEFGYRLELFKEGTISAMADYFINLVIDVISNKTMLIGLMGNAQKEVSQNVFGDSDFIL